MPHVPRVAPVPVVIQVAGLPVAGTAQDADPGCAEPLRILNRRRAGGFRVRAPRPVARFAVDPEFAGLHLKLAASAIGPTVATETEQSARSRVEHAVDDIGGRLVSPGDGQGFRRRIVGQAVLGYGVLAGLADPGDRFCARRRPLRSPRAWIGGQSFAERPRVLRFRLGCELRRMAAPAH